MLQVKQTHTAEPSSSSPAGTDRILLVQARAQNFRFTNIHSWILQVLKQPLCLSISSVCVPACTEAQTRGRESASAQRERDKRKFNERKLLDREDSAVQPQGSDR